MQSIIIENVAVPVLDANKKTFIPPDLEPALDYYPQFLKYAKLSPIQYINRVVGKFGDTGDERAKIWDALSHHLGVKFRNWLKENNALFNTVSDLSATDGATEQVSGISETPINIGRDDRI